MNTAQIIATQIGKQALYMIGATNLSGDNTKLQFKVGRNSKGITHVEIKLNSLDTYTVTYYKVRGSSCKEAKVSEGVYVDMLHADLERSLEMRLSLTNVYA